MSSEIKKNKEETVIIKEGKEFIRVEGVDRKNGLSDKNKENENYDEVTDDFENGAESQEGGYYDKLIDQKRLGFKSKLDLALRHALKALESETSKVTGLCINDLRKEFSFLPRRATTKQELVAIIPIHLVMYDYRSFLISTIALYKKKRKKVD